MQNLRFEILIIGAGPSGCIAGISLERLGIKTCILDKEKFPRDKVCGGLLTQKTINILKETFPDKNISSFYDYSLIDVDLYYKKRKVTSIKSKYPFYFTNRKSFDNLLVQEYIDNGGTLIENTRFTASNLRSMNLYKDENRLIEFKVLIGADGALSDTRKIVNPKYECKAFGISSKVDSHTELNKVGIFFGTIRSGYSWKFPNSDFINIGTGGYNSKKNDVLNKFKLFCIQNNISNESIITIKGAFSPSGKCIKKPYNGNNIVLIGDAAGFIDPITGEGLYFAIKSAKILSNSVYKFLQGKVTDLGESYKKDIRSIYQIISDANFFKWFLYNRFIQIIFLITLALNNIFARYYLEKVMSTYEKKYRYFAFNFIFDLITLRLWKKI